MSAYFITGCGTAIGKTFATCALIYAARATGMETRAYKPIISGFDDRQPEGSDTANIMQALGIPLDDYEALADISPLRFTAPLSPSMAAARQNMEIDFSALVDWTQTHIRAARDHNYFTLIEGVGGVMVPLTNSHTVRDWMAPLNIPAIVVTGSYLGSISHTLTTLEALRAANISIAALIVSESADSTVPLDGTLSTLQCFSHDIPLRIAQSRVSSPAEATHIHALLEHIT